MITAAYWLIRGSLSWCGVRAKSSEPAGFHPQRQIQGEYGRQHMEIAEYIREERMVVRIGPASGPDSSGSHGSPGAKRDAEGC